MVETNVHQGQVLLQGFFVSAVLQVLFEALVELFHKTFLFVLRLHSFPLFLLELLHNNKVRLAIAIVIVIVVIIRVMSREFVPDSVMLLQIEH